MIKLKEIIKSGGGNTKINRFINRYVLSKKEKNEIINEIKNIKGNGSSSGSSIKYVPKYYSIKEDIPDEYREIVLFGSTVKYKCNNKLYINPTSTITGDSLTLVGVSFNPIHTEITNGYVDSIEELLIILGKSELVLSYIERITEKEYYKID